MSGQWPKSKGKGKASDAKEAQGAYEATVVGGRRIGKQKKKKKKGTNKNQGKDGGLKRKLVRGVCPKTCVLCCFWSEGDDPSSGVPPLMWGHPRHAKGVEGSECYWCRRLHRAKAFFECCLIYIYIYIYI